MNIVIMGPQGSGKGTQAEMLEEKYGIKHISTGDIFREMAKTDEKIRKMLEKGELLSDEIVLPAVRNATVKYPDGFILDGTPRNLHQAKKLGIKIDFVIYLDIPDSMVIERLSSRTQCRKCRAIYGKDMPPLKNDKCDKCGSELCRREDDKPESIKERLKIFHEETEKVVKYYEEKKILHKVNAMGAPEEIFGRVVKILSTP